MSQRDWIIVGVVAVALYLLVFRKKIATGGGLGTPNYGGIPPTYPPSGFIPPQTQPTPSAGAGGWSGSDYGSLFGGIGQGVGGILTGIGGIIGASGGSGGDDGGDWY